MRLKLALLALLLSGAAQAQTAASIDADWKEAAPPPPPAVRTEGLIPVTMPGSALAWGVDPKSISIGPDSVVRYVVVAVGEGATNAVYEGVRCSSAEVKQYQRSSGGEWREIARADWKPLHGSSSTRHSLAVARNGACIGQGTNTSAEQIARDLGRRDDKRFRPEFR